VSDDSAICSLGAEEVRERVLAAVIAHAQDFEGHLDSGILMPETDVFTDIRDKQAYLANCLGVAIEVSAILLQVWSKMSDASLEDAARTLSDVLLGRTS
jgi:hypothetical protein